MKLSNFQSSKFQEKVVNYFQKINLAEQIERYKYLLLSFIVLVAAILIETNTFNFRFGEHHAERFQKLLQNKERYIQQEFSSLYAVLENEPQLKAYVANHSEKYNEQGIVILIYKNEKLQLWGQSLFYISEQYDSSLFSQRVVQLSNAWYSVQTVLHGNNRFVGLTLIKNEYPYENKFLANSFQNDFNVSEALELLTNNQKLGFPIFDSKGVFLFSLKENRSNSRNAIHRNISIAFYFLFIVILLAAVHNNVRRFRKQQAKIAFNISFFFVVVFIRILMMKFEFPYVFHFSSLFDYQYFAASEYIPSLGDLLIDSILLLYFVVQMRLFFRQRAILASGAFMRKVVIYFVPLVIVLWYLGVNYVVKTMVLNSNVSFGLNNFLNLSFLSFVGIFIISLLLYSFIIVANSYYSTIARVFTFSEFRKKSMFVIIGASLLFFLIDKVQIAIIETVIFFVINAVLVHIYFKQKGRLGFYSKMLIMLLFALYAQFQIHFYFEQRQESIQRMYALTIADEHDPIAEILLLREDTILRKDSTLIGYLQHPFGLEDEINEYLQENYYNGFMKRYELRSTICSDSPLSNPANVLSNCEPYFATFLNKYGFRLPNSNYYFTNDYSGGIGYFTQVNYLTADSSHISLYIELTQKLMAGELGYPELLLQKRNENQYLNSLSYARYKGNKLISQTGKVAYPLYASKQNSDSVTDLFQTESDEYVHYHYAIGKDSEIVVSRRKQQFFDRMVSFSYLFLFLFLVYLCIDLPIAIASKGYKVNIDFKKRIQFSIISILILSLILIGGSMVYLNYSQYRDAQYEAIKEKLFSVVTEMKDRFQEDDLFDSNSSEMLYYNLVRLSNIYFTDINIYDKQGRLMTSSRREIFDYQLTGNYIDYSAYYELTEKNSPFYIANDNIGDLNYISAYMGIKDKNDETIAFLNLPYFTKQEEITNRLSSLIVTLINIYVMLLLIAVTAAVLISGNIIRPLELLKLKFRDVSFGKKNEPIVWKRNDEIGSLINHYNYMMMQLEQSAALLAESERKGAWQEMARQIAHEIKNPLTPMKLNIQLLNRAWDAGVDDFDERLKRVSKSIIEQIDVLAATANEFSNFAKQSQINWDNVALQDVLESVVVLFSDNEAVEIVRNFDTSFQYVVRADREKLTRVFNNIIKNAIQAIPKSKRGCITVTCTLDGESALVTIADNGVGIPEELQSRLFEPNFTTKSSGSGLGLSICRNILELFDGTIWFETKPGIGTDFIIKLPILSE